MVSFLGLYSTTLFLLVTNASGPTPIMAEEIKVGGAEGWRVPAATETDLYARWSQTMRFHVGDSLCFVYKNDSVMVVEKYGYYHCNSTHPTSVFKDGNTVIKLERPGPAYFVSSNPDHYKNGQKLMVEVITLISRSPPQPTDGASPAPSPSAAAECFSVVPVMVYLAVTAVSIRI